MLYDYLNKMKMSENYFVICDVDEFAKISDFENNLIYQIENYHKFSAKEILNILVNIIPELQTELKNNKERYDFKRPLLAKCIFYKDDKIKIRQTSKKEYKNAVLLTRIIQKIVAEILDTAERNGMYDSENRLELIKNFKKPLWQWHNNQEPKSLWEMNGSQILEELKKIININENHISAKKV